MKKAKSKKKTASKTQQSKKIARKQTNRNVTSLCSCVGHQVTSDSSSENLSGEGASQHTTGCGQIHLSKSLLDEGCCTHSQNTSSDQITQDNRHPTKTKSSEFIHLFYTIVADEDFKSEPSDSEGSVTSDVHYEVMVDVHHNASAKSIVHVANNVNEPRSHSGINTNNAVGNDSEKEPWFAYKDECFSPIVDPRGEGESDLTKPAEETEYYEQNSPRSDGTDASLSLDCTESTQQISCEKEYMDFVNEVEHDIFQKESYLYVIEEVSEEDCESISNTSMETVKNISPPSQSTVEVQDASQYVPPTKLNTSLGDSKENSDFIPSSGDGAELSDGVILSNTVDQISVSDEQARPRQLLDNLASNAQEASVVFSQDQTYTEIIASGSRMVDEVKELLSELLDVCMQSRANDAGSVAAHGDFAEASEISSTTSLTDIAETQNGDHGIQRAAIIDGSDLAGRDMDKVRSWDEIHVDLPADHECGNNETSFSFKTPSDEFDVPVDHFSNNKLSVSLEISSDEVDLPPDKCINNNQPLSLETSSHEIDIPFDKVCGNNEKPLSLETVIFDEKFCGSSINESPTVGSLDYEPQHETQPENAINDTQPDDDDRIPTELLMNNNQRVSETVEDYETPVVIISENTKIESGDLLYRTDEVWPVKKIEGYDLPDVTSIQETSNDEFNLESPQIVKIIGVDIERDSKTEEALLENLAPEHNVDRDVQTSFENQIVKIVGVDIKRDSNTEETLFENLSSEEDIGGDVQTQFENQIVKIVGVDIDQESKRENALFENIASEKEVGGDVQTPFENRIVKIVGVDIEQVSNTEEALLEKLVSSEEDMERDVQTPFENQIVKIIGVDNEQESKTEETLLKNLEKPREQNPFDNQIVDVDVESSSDLDVMDMHCIKIIGIDVESHLPDSVDEDGDSSVMKDMSLCDINEENRILVGTELYSVVDQSQDIANSSQDVITCTEGDGYIGDGMIIKESEGSEITKVEPMTADKAPPSGHEDTTGDTSDDYDETQKDMNIKTNDLNQENAIPTGCNLPTRQGSNATATSPSLSHSSFEILGQEVLEDDFVMVPYSSTIIVPPPQEEYNGELMSPEFEADDIIVNFATVSAMGDVAHAQRRSGIAPVAPPNPVQFEDVNSRSPSPLPQTDLTLLDCLFDICEERLQRFPYKIVPPPRSETYIRKKSEPLELSPDCLGEQGDNIQNDNQSSPEVIKNLFGSVSRDDEGFFCCHLASSDSFCSLLSTETEHDRPLITQDSLETYFSFETFSDSIEAEEEPLPLQKDISLDFVPEPNFQQTLHDQIILYEIVRPRQESDVPRLRTDETPISQLTKEHKDDNQKHLENTSGTVNSYMLVPVSKEDDADESLVFFLALFTLSVFVYYKYGPRIIQAIMHWLWICQLIIQLLTDS